MAAVNNNTVVVVNAVGPIIVDAWIDHPNVTGLVSTSLRPSFFSNTDVRCGAVCRAKKQVNKSSRFCICLMLSLDYRKCARRRPVWRVQSEASIFLNTGPCIPLSMSSSGRLPFTIAKSEDDYPAKVDTTSSVTTVQIPYTEGLFIDYRHFDAVRINESSDSAMFILSCFFRRISILASNMVSDSRTRLLSTPAWRLSGLSPAGPPVLLLDSARPWTLRTSSALTRLRLTSTHVFQVFTRM